MGAPAKPADASDSGDAGLSTPREIEQPEVGQTVGRYVLFDEIASGGMASVHYGRMRGSVGFARSVAVKRLHAHHATEPDFVAMFLDEARLAARIHHSNVVDTLDVVSVGRELILVMEYVHGESLSALLKQVRRAGAVVPPAIAAAIISGVLHGLHAAHEATSEQGTALGIVHRDVSPQNVIVGADGVARVLDFGVAKALTRTQTTREGQLKGKLAYMAPEQLRRGVVDRKTDIYAASVVLWETLTAERLHDADDEGGLVMSILEAKAEPPSAHVAGIDAALDAVVMRGLSANAADRYPTALAMADALDKAVVAARPREVGDWVAGVARATLAKRAARLAEIERLDLGSEDTPSNAPTNFGRALQRPRSESLTMPLEQEQSHVKAVEVPREPRSGPASSTMPFAPAIPAAAPSAPSAPSAPITESRISVGQQAPAQSSRGPVIAIVASLIVLVASCAAWAIHRNHKLHAAAAVVPTASSSNEPGISMPPIAPIAPNAPVAPVAPPSPDTAAANPATSPPIATPGPPRAKPTRKRPAVDSCDPPYFIDESGVKRFKKHCL